jgi:hypothetical protein
LRTVCPNQSVPSANDVEADDQAGPELSLEEVGHIAMLIMDSYPLRSPIHQAMLLLAAYGVPTAQIAKRLRTTTSIVEKLLGDLKLTKSDLGEQGYAKAYETIRRLLQERYPEANVLSVVSRATVVPTKHEVANRMRFLSASQLNVIAYKVTMTPAMLKHQLRTNYARSSTDFSDIRATLGLIYTGTEETCDLMIAGYRIFMAQHRQAES